MNKMTKSTYTIHGVRLLIIDSSYWLMYKSTFFHGLKMSDDQKQEKTAMSTFVPFLFYKTYGFNNF